MCRFWIIVVGDVALIAGRQQRRRAIGLGLSAARVATNAKRVWYKHKLHTACTESVGVPKLGGICSLGRCWEYERGVMTFGDEVDYQRHNRDNGRGYTSDDSLATHKLQVLA